MEISNRSILLIYLKSKVIQISEFMRPKQLGLVG